MSITLVALDDHPLIMEGVLAVVRREAPDIDVVAVAATWTDLLRSLMARADRPQVALMDLHLGDGSEPAERVATLNSLGVQVVVLTSEMRPVPVRAALQAGALGLALKSDPPAQLVEVIRAAARGESSVSGDLAYLLLTDPELAPHLPPRELEALRLLAEGVPRKSVGSHMDPPIGTATVITYLNRACARYREIGRPVSFPGDAVRAAMADGYLDTPAPQYPQQPSSPA